MLDDTLDPVRPTFPTFPIMSHTIRDLVPDEHWVKLLHEDVLNLRFGDPNASRIVKTLMKAEVLLLLCDDPRSCRQIMDAVAKNCHLWTQRGIHPDSGIPA